MNAWKRFAALAGLLSSFAMVPAQAQEQDSVLSWNWIGAGYETYDVDGLDADYDGIGISGSFEVADQLFATAGYATASGDVKTLVFRGFGRLPYPGKVDIDVDTLSVGMGYHTPMSDTADMFFTGSLINQDVDVDGFFGSSDRETGFGLSAGVRALLTDNFEGSAELSYVDVVDDDIALGLSGAFKITQQFDVGASLTLGDDAEALGIFARMFF